MRLIFQVSGGLGMYLVNIVDEVPGINGAEALSVHRVTMLIPIERWIEFCRRFDEDDKAEVVLVS